MIRSKVGEIGHFLGDNFEFLTKFENKLVKGFSQILLLVKHLLNLTSAIRKTILCCQNLPFMHNMAFMIKNLYKISAEIVKKMLKGQELVTNASKRY